MIGKARVRDRRLHNVDTARIGPIVPSFQNDTLRTFIGRRHLLRGEQRLNFLVAGKGHRRNGRRIYLFDAGQLAHTLVLGTLLWAV